MAQTPRSGSSDASTRPPASSFLLTRLEWCLLWAIACTAVGGHVLLAIWWEVGHSSGDDEKSRHEVDHAHPHLDHATRLALKSLATDMPDPKALRTLAGDTSFASEVTAESDEGDDVSKAVDDILASRGEEPRMRRPLLAVKPQTGAYCGGTLPQLPHGQRSDQEVEDRLSIIFKQASGFWAADAEETKHVADVASAAGGPKATCAEATYGEIQVKGLRMVLEELVRVQDAHRPSNAAPFKAFVDLGAGVGRTAAAAVLLGLASDAYGVELGPQRFAMGCQALTNASDAVGGPRNLIAKPRVDLAQGDAREWAEITAEKWPSCRSDWAFFIGAECFRDSLLGSVGRAIARACEIGAHIAVLGRRFPAELTDPGVVNGAGPGVVGDGPRHVKELGSVMAPTTWSTGVEVHLYTIVAG